MLLEFEDRSTINLNTTCVYLKGFEEKYASRF